VSLHKAPALHCVSSVHALRQAEPVPPREAQLLPLGQAAAVAGSPPQGREQYPFVMESVQKAGLSPQSASEAQPLPTREALQVPLGTSQLADAQSASRVHFGRQRLPPALVKQRCSTRQSAFALQVSRQSLEVALTAMHAERDGQVAPLGVQSLVQ